MAGRIPMGGKWLGLGGLGILILAAAIGAGEPVPAETVKAGPFAMRGFGKVSLTASRWDAPATALSVFACEDPTKANVVAGKYLADLLGYGATSRIKVAGTNAPGVEVRHGGAFLVGCDGKNAMVAWAETPEALAKAVAERPDWRARQWRAPGTPGTPAYPRYLDCFDNAAFGLWYMPNTKPRATLDWVQGLPGILNLHQQRLDANPVPEVVDLSGALNVAAQAAWVNKPYRFMLWSGIPEWWNPRPADDTGERAHGHSGGRRLFEAGGYNDTQNSSADMNAVMMNSMFRVMRAFVDRDDVVAWMEPHGEFHLTPPPRLPPGYATRYPAVRRERLGYASPAAVADAYGEKAGAYRDWNDIPYPDLAFFRGRRAPFVDLDAGKWKWRSETIENGLAAGYGKPDFDDSSWTAEPRDSYRVLSHGSTNRGIQHAWFRFDADVPETFLKSVPADKPVYLHVMPMNDRVARKMWIWVNGEPILQGEANFIDKGGENTVTLVHFEVDVRKYLKPGSNRFAIGNEGGRVAYRVFLSPHAGGVYPFADGKLSRRWLDWRSYLVDEKFQILEHWLKGMRAVDDRRPIKVMTPFMFQADAMQAFAKYGGYPQLTGEGAFFRPMHYKGYARLHGLPGSSEFGGPPKTRLETQKHFATMLYESQDAHDYVFDPQRDIQPYPEAVAWLNDNHGILKALGKTDFPAATLGLLRDTRQDTLYANGAIWNWDLSRGPLPVAGVSPVLVDGLDMERGLANHLPLVLDCATWVTGAGQVKAIREYVERGGTFVALHNTGRHGEYERDSWPLAAAFGLKAEPKNLNDGNYHTWPMAKLTFTAEQDLIPSLKGRTLQGSGVSINYINEEQSGGVAIIPNGGNVRPVAKWEDGTLAIAEVKAGKGRFIWLGTPFHVRFRDVAGQWINDGERQGYFEEMLKSLGYQRDTSVSNSKVWAERRESKNGLYDVVMACYLAPPAKAKLEDIEKTVPGLAASTARAAIEPTKADCPDVTTKFADGFVTMGEQPFEPYQLREWAVVKDRVGFVAPRHWLEKQKDHWRALEPVPAKEIIETVDRTVAKYAAVGGTGFSVSDDWKALPNPTAVEGDPLAWTRPEYDDAYWQRVSLGAWFVQSWTDVEKVRYRKAVELPKEWLAGKDRILLGVTGHLGVMDTGRLWINGKESSMSSSLRRWGRPVVDISAEARQAGGKLSMALEVEGRGDARGFFGTLYVQKYPAPADRLEIKDGWRMMERWDQPDGPAVKLPLAKQRMIGLRCRVKVPEAWKGKMIRLVLLEADGGTPNTGIDGVMINDTGYYRQMSLAPLGARLDRWLEPGKENVIDFFGAGFMSEGYAGWEPKFGQAWLEVYDAP